MYRTRVDAREDAMMTLPNFVSCVVVIVFNKNSKYRKCT